MRYVYNLRLFTKYWCIFPHVIPRHVDDCVRPSTRMHAYTRRVCQTAILFIFMYRHAYTHCVCKQLSHSYLRTCMDAYTRFVCK